MSNDPAPSPPGALAGKVFVVTGGTSGTGEAIVLAAAAEGASTWSSTLGVTLALAGVGGLAGVTASERVTARVGLFGTMAAGRVLEATGIAVIAAAVVAPGATLVLCRPGSSLVVSDSAWRGRWTSPAARPSPRPVAGSGEHHRAPREPGGDRARSPVGRAAG